MNDESSSGDRFALLTPRARGAVATLVVSAHDLIEKLETLFCPAGNRSLGDALRSAPGKFVYGNWINEDGTRGEDLILCPPGIPDSNHDPAAEITRLEIHCHGGISASTAITDSLERIGFVAGTAHELVSDSNMDFWLREVDRALARATTETTAMLLLQQREKWPAQIALLNSLVTADDSAAAADRIRRVLARSESGLRLTQPARVVLCGAPNAGKSSLINAIVGFRRAIVHQTPGTTRDIVSQETAINGWPVEIKDTAGLRESAGDLEQQGIALAGAEIENADCAVVVIDVSVTARADRSTLDLIRSARRPVLVLNKIDLETGTEFQLEEIEQAANLPVPVVRVSAKTGEGVPELIALLGDWLTPPLPAPSSPGEDGLLPVTPEQVVRLEQILDLLGQAKTDAALRMLGH